MFCDSFWRGNLAVILFLLLATVQFVSGCVTAIITWPNDFKK